MAYSPLDASSLLALLNAESGAEKVAAVLSGAVVSAVNLSEVVAKLAESGIPEESIHRALEGLALEVVSFNREQAYRAGQLRPLTRALGLSLGDRACLGLAQQLGLPALTTDADWAELELGIQVQVIR